MRRPGSNFRTWSLMAAVAIAAVCAAATRPESAPSAAVVIIGACVLVLAHHMYSEALAQRLAGGATIGPTQRAVLSLASAALASAVIGLSDLAFLAGYYGFMRLAYQTVVMSHWSPYDDPGYMVVGVAIGMPLALCVASSLRHTVWAPGGLRHPRWWRELWPVALAVCVGTLWFADEMRERYSFCRRMADYHAGPETRVDVPNKDALHDWLSRWYERASVRPWMPIHPDRVPPGLE